MTVEVVDDHSYFCLVFKRTKHPDQFFIRKMMRKQGTSDDIYLLMLKSRIENICGFKTNIREIPQIIGRHGNGVWIGIYTDKAGVEFFLLAPVVHHPDHIASSAANIGNGDFLSYGFFQELVNAIGGDVISPQQLVDGFQLP